MSKAPSPFDMSPQPQPAPLRPTVKRFWREAAIAPEGGGYRLLLDGRPARTPGRRPLTVPTLVAAQVLADEWNAVADVIKPADMPMTRLANSAIDGVADRIAEVRADIVKYAASDLLCYRAAGPEQLVARQNELWDPLLDWAREALGARMVLAEGVMFVVQPPEAVAAIARAVAAAPAPCALAALHMATTMTGSALLALALSRGRLDAAAAWTAAHVDEDAQMQIWGIDEEALQRRAQRRREFDAAALMLAP